MARRTWVTADTHLGEHEAIARFRRPFGDVREMDDAIIDRLNARVGRRDELLHLGDVFGSLDWESKGARRDARRTLARIRCRRIRLVLGNKDPDRRSFRALFGSAAESATLRARGPAGERGPRVVCHHYPLRQWRGMWDGALHLHGHAHGSLEELGRSTDVGVDRWEYSPVPLDELVALLAARPVPRMPEMGSRTGAGAQPPL